MTLSLSHGIVEFSCFFFLLAWKSIRFFLSFFLKTTYPSNLSSKSTKKLLRISPILLSNFLRDLMFTIYDGAIGFFSKAFGFFSRNNLVSPCLLWYVDNTCKGYCVLCLEDLLHMSYQGMLYYIFFHQTITIIKASYYC